MVNEHMICCSSQIDASSHVNILLVMHRSCLFVTTRILVVDLLSGRLHGRHVSGIVVLNAHRVNDTSGNYLLWDTRS